MEKFNRWSFAMGIAFCMAVAGCMMAVSDPGNANTGWRYEFIGQSNSFFRVFDRQTGTTNSYDTSTDTVTVYQFSAQ
jgi:hypothetical protein